MYVFTDTDGWVINIAVADREIPELTAMGGVYLDDTEYVDVYQNPSWYKVIGTQPIKQEAERPADLPKKTELEILTDELTATKEELATAKAAINFILLNF